MVDRTTLNKLREMRLGVMAKTLAAEEGSSEALPFDERFAALVEAEWLERKNRRVSRLIKAAAFRFPASLEEIDLANKRGITKNELLRLAEGTWLKKKQNLVFSGPTGVGKTYIANALGRCFCARGVPVKYFRLPDLFLRLSDAQAERRYSAARKNLAQAPLLILDDWGLRKFSLDENHELMELFEQRYGRASTLICGQLPAAEWHALFPDPTLADAVLDRVVHNALKYNLSGDSMRKILAEKEAGETEN